MNWALDQKKVIIKIKRGNVHMCSAVFKGAPGGGGYCHIWAIWVCAAVKGMVFKQFTLG